VILASVRAPELLRPGWWRFDTANVDRRCVISVYVAWFARGVATARVKRAPSAAASKPASNKKELGRGAKERKGKERKGKKR
tara:strand:+ start:238 stop:483 length:246 start_codon:yes stop_codon:yes gene_type:complete